MGASNMAEKRKSFCFLLVWPMPGRESWGKTRCCLNPCPCPTFSITLNHVCSGPQTANVLPKHRETLSPRFGAQTQGAELTWTAPRPGGQPPPTFLKWVWAISFKGLRDRARLPRPGCASAFTAICAPGPSRGNRIMDARPGAPGRGPGRGPGCSNLLSTLATDKSCPLRGRKTQSR